MAREPQEPHPLCVLSGCFAFVRVYLSVLARGDRACGELFATDVSVQHALPATSVILYLLLCVPAEYREPETKEVSSSHFYPPREIASSSASPRTFVYRCDVGDAEAEPA